MNAHSNITAGSARAVSRRLLAPADLLNLYARLSDRGQRPDTMLFETKAGPSIILDRAAVRIECRKGKVTIDALTSGGETVTGALAQALGDRLAERSDLRLVLSCDRPTELDAKRRLLGSSPFDVLRAIRNLFPSESGEEPFTVCLIGVVGFDHVDLFEDLPQSAEDPIDFPDFIFWLAESAIIREQRMTPRLICTAFGAGSEEQRKRAHFSAIDRLSGLAGRVSDVRPIEPAEPKAGDISVDLDDESFAGIVSKVQEHILAGDAYQVVISRTFSMSCNDALGAFARLRSIDFSPYTFFVSMKGLSLFGCSPETSVRVSQSDGRSIVEVKPIAGTRPRGQGFDEDDRMEADLRLDAKEAAEHMMLVDLARNDVARISRPGTRHVSQFMSVEKYARVMHLVSSVEGELAPDFDALHALQACLNPGTLSGTPKLKATELIRTYERTRRGFYGGSIGWLNGEGSLDTGIVIRSGLVKDEIAYVRAGAGIVQDSIPSAEADETRHKASAVLSAIVGELGK